MTPDHPWIEAVLSSFRKGDPRNGRRRDLLFEASGAVPDSWGGATGSIPPVPASLARAVRPRRFAIDVLLVLAALLLLWTLWLSPDARYRLRGIALADYMDGSISATRLSGPLPAWSGFDAEENTGRFLQFLGEDLRRRIPAEKHDICLGRREAQTSAERWVELWASAPDNPVTLANQARSIQESDGQIPQALLERAATVDPGNAYYRMLAMSGTAQDCISEVRGGTRTHPGAPGTWRIDDPDAFALAWADLESILACEASDSRREPLMRRRIDGWPAAQDFPDLARDSGWRFLVMIDHGRPGTNDAVRLLCAKAERAAASGSVEEMERLCGHWRRLLELTLEQDGLIHWTSLSSFNGSPSEGMAEACDKLGMSAEARFFRDAVAAVVNHQRLHPGWEAGPTSSSLNIPTLHPSSLNPAPGRLAEHRMFEGLYLAVAATVLLLLGLVTLVVRTLTTHRLLGLPSRLTSLLRPADHLRIVAIGMLLPVTVVFATLEIPFLHPRPETFDATDALAVLLKLAALATGILLLTTLEILRALARRGLPLGFGPTASLPLLLLGLLALACAPAASVFLRSDLSSLTDEAEWIWTGFFGMLGLILVAFFTGAVVLISTGSRRLQTATAGHLLTRHLVVAALLIASLVPVYRSIESRHVADARAERIDTPEALDTMLGRTPLQTRIRQIYLDYLATAPEG